MYYGYAGKILEVNLNAGKVVEKELDLQFARRFIGGLGFNAKILYDEVGPSVDPFGPDNVVAIAPGALCGTDAPTAARTEVTTKSPLTGIIGSGNFGGYWGPALKRAGYDAVIIRGESEKPVYLWVDNDRVEIREAAHLWGRDTFETTNALKKELGQNINVLSIGQAGENLVRFADVTADYYYSPGRCHAGGVLGAKRLKAIAVQGKKKIAIKSPTEFKRAIREVEDRIPRYPGWKPREKAGSIGDTTPALAETVAKYLTRGDKYCYCHCPLGEYYGCTLIADIKTGKYAGTKIINASYTHYGVYVKALGIDFPAAWKIKELSNRYGMDSHPGRLSYLMRIFQKGIITKKDTDGLDLTKGNDDAFIEMLRKIAYREGFGDFLAEGFVRAARKIGRGAEEELLTVKGAEAQGVLPPRQELARLAGMRTQLSFLTCPRGGDDLKNQHALHDFPRFSPWARELNWSEEEYIEWLLGWLDMFEDVKNKTFGVPPRLRSLSDLDEQMITVWYGDLTCAYDALGLCMFAVNATNVIGATHCGNLLAAATGWDITAQEFMKTGERIYNLMRAYSVREGMTRKDDHWPARFYGRSFPKKKIDRLLDRYYELRGWDKKTGIPTAQKLVELRLDEVIDQLQKLGCL